MNAQEHARDETVLGLTANELMLVIGLGGFAVAAVIVVVALVIAGKCTDGG